MGLNEPRKIDYDFKLILYDGWVWLFDDSERSYLCSTQASVYAVPVFKEGKSPWETEQLYEAQPEACYTDAVYFSGKSLIDFPMIDLVVVEKDEDEDEAWNIATEQIWDSMGDYEFPKS